MEFTEIILFNWYSSAMILDIAFWNWRVSLWHFILIIWSLEYTISYFIIFNLTEKIVILKHIISIIMRRSFINWISMWFKLILLLFATVWTLDSRSLFWYNGGYPNNNFSHLCLSKTKKANNVHINLDTKPYLAHDTKYFFSLY